MIKKRSITILFILAILCQIIAVPVFARNNNNPNKLLGSPAYVLNIHGKKADWNANGDFSNPDRHTMFVPRGSMEFNSIIRLYMTQAVRGSLEGFMVLDGNAFGGDGRLELQIADGYYAVYVTALGKPLDPAQTTDITGVVPDALGNPMLFLGGVDGKSLKPHGKTPVWEEYTDLFYIDENQMIEFFMTMGGFSEARAIELVDAIIAHFSPDYVIQVGVDSFGDPIYAIWIFDFYEFLTTNYQALLTEEELLDIGDILNGEYYWNLINKGIRHIQVRFYKVGNRDWGNLV